MSVIVGAGPIGLAALLTTFSSSHLLRLSWLDLSESRLEAARIWGNPPSAPVISLKSRSLSMK